MGVYKSSAQLYACLEKLFERLSIEHPDAGVKVTESKLLIRLRCHEPRAEILINGRRRPAKVSYGTNRVRPELDIELAGDTLHLLLLGEITVPRALSRKLLKVRGPAWKTLTLVDIFKECQEFYAQLLNDMNLPAC